LAQWDEGERLDGTNYDLIMMEETRKFSGVNPME
jgi:hypothetical protein